MVQGQKGVFPWDEGAGVFGGRGRAVAQGDDGFVEGIAVGLAEEGLEAENDFGGETHRPCPAVGAHDLLVVSDECEDCVSRFGGGYWGWNRRGFGGLGGDGGVGGTDPPR